MFTIVATILSLLISMASLSLGILKHRIPPFYDRKEIVYGHSESVPVMEEGMSGVGLRVEYHSRLVDNPHRIWLKISNTGGSGLNEKMFHGGLSLEFDFGAEVIAILEKYHNPKSALDLPVSASGNILSVGPGMIPRRMCVEYLLLTDGVCMEVDCRKNPIEDTGIKKIRWIEEATGQPGLKIKTLVQWLLIAFVVWWITTQPSNAGHLVDEFGSLLSRAADGLARFVTAV